MSISSIEQGHQLSEEDALVPAHTIGGKGREVVSELLTKGEPRGRETADEIRERFLGYLR